MRRCVQTQLSKDQAQGGQHSEDDGGGFWPDDKSLLDHPSHVDQGRHHPPINIACLAPGDDNDGDDDVDDGGGGVDGIVGVPHTWHVDHVCHCARPQRETQNTGIISILLTWTNALGSTGNNNAVWDRCRSISYKWMDGIGLGIDTGCFLC